MNTKLIYLLLPAVYLFIGCADSKQEADNNTRVPISLMADNNGISAATRAAVTWDATLCASTTSGDYLNQVSEYEWNKDVTVATDGSITFAPEVYYPSNGNWIYIVGVSPKVIPADGQAIYEDAIGQSDLLYAKEIRGNKWKVDQFNANNKLEFERLYTQLIFCAVPTPNQSASNLNITKIVIKGVNTRAIIGLGDGNIDWSTPTDRVLTLNAMLNTNVEQELKTIMLSPKSSYELEVTTNLGVFGGTVAPTTGNAFLAGHSHKITFTFTDNKLEFTTIAVDEWVTESAGDFDVN